MHHNFSIHSSVDGHLGCFHVIAIVDAVGEDRVGQIERIAWKHIHHYK